jgi:hypothetical protein
MAEITEIIVICVGDHEWLKPHPIERDQIVDAGWMDTQGQDHRRRLRTIVGNFVAGANLH